MDKHHSWQIPPKSLNVPRVKQKHTKDIGQIQDRHPNSAKTHIMWTSGPKSGKKVLPSGKPNALDVTSVDDDE